MPSFQKALLAAALFMLAFMSLQQSADAHEVTISLPSEGSWIDTSELVGIGATVIIDESGRLKYTPKLNGAGLEPTFDLVPVVGEPAQFSYSFTPADLQTYCIDGSIRIGVTVVFAPTGEDGGPDIGDQHLTYPCGYGAQPEIVYADLANLHVLSAVCGDMNDIVDYIQDNVTVTGTQWLGNDLVFSLKADTGFIFPDGPTTTITYIDAGNCIINEQVPRPIQVDVCGPANDTFENGGELPVGVNPVPTVSANGDTLTVTYSTQAEYEFPDGSISVSFNFTDEDTSCDIVITDPLTPPTIVQQCGANNDTVTPAGSQPAGVVVQPVVSEYSDTGLISLIYSAAQGHVFADGYNNVIEHTDVGDNCPVLTVDIDDTTFMNLPSEGRMTITGSLVLDNVDLNNATNQQLSLDGTEVTFWSRLQDGSTWRYEWAPNNSDLRAMCTDGEFLVEASVDVTMYGVTETYAIDSYTVPCSLGPDSIVVTPTGDVTQIEICGFTYQQMNDIVTFVPHEGVVVDRQVWTNGELLIIVEPAPGYVFPEGSETTIRIRDFDTQCEPSVLDIDETQQVLMNVRAGQQVTISATLDLPEGNPYDIAALKLVPGTGKELSASLTPTLGTGGVHSVEFPYTIPANFAEVCADNDGQMSMDLTAYLEGPHPVDPGVVTDDMEIIAVLPCSHVELVTPDADLIVQTHICGDANDTFSTSQEGVELTIGEWVENETTITFTPADGYGFTEDSTTTTTVTDEGLCVVSPVMPFLEQEVCGPDNDLITIPEQPDGVIINDSDWDDGGRNISWTPEDGYTFPEGTPNGMIATDRNTACDVEPIGVQLTVILNTSDGGSIEGTPYQLFAPVASQTVPLPYDEGVVDADNRIVIGALLPGEYRLVIAPEGYVAVDTVLTVTAGNDQQEISVDLAAIQQPTTSTPSPTAEPTSTPSPTAEVTAEPDPTATSAVSGLPETGTGNGGNSLIPGLAGLLAAAMAVVIVGFRGNRARGL